MKLLKNKVTRQAILFTLLILVVYRLGSYIITPLVNGNAIMGDDAALGIDNLFGLLGGGNIRFLTLFALGVSPYITSSIVIQLLENDLIPAISEWKHQGIDGQNKRYAWTKYLAVIFAFVQALGITFGLYFLKSNDIIQAIPFTEGSVVGVLEFLVIALFLTAGSTILMWLADRITEKGIGNGMSVIIMVGILSRMPKELASIGTLIHDAAYNGQKGIIDFDFLSTSLTWILIFVIFLLLVIVIVYYTLAYRRIDINYVKNAKSLLAQRSYIPIKLNPAGVIPVIFVAPLMQVPILILSLPVFANNNPEGGYGPYETVVRAFFQLNGEHWYIAIILYFFLILGFSIMYSYIQMNPKDMAENLEKQSAYVIGVRPGEDTEKYITDIITRTTVYGGIVLGLLAILPTILQNVLSLTVNLQLMGTGLIITVNVLVQTYQAMENKSESKTYKRLFE